MRVPARPSHRRRAYRPPRSRAAGAVVLAGLVTALAPVPALAQPAVEEGYRVLFDGTSTAGWQQAGPGGFTLADGVWTTSGGLGLQWYSAQEFGSYSLRADWRYGGEGNSGIFVGFPPSDDPWSAVSAGYEIQIDPADDAGNTTGAIYGASLPDAAAAAGAIDSAPGAWNTTEVLVEGQRIRVYVNGTQVNDFTNTDPARGLGRGHIGLQNHGDADSVSFDDVRIKELAPAGTDFPAGTGQPDQVPGVTLRTFDISAPMSRICTLKSAQTPNVDKLMPTIDWRSTGDFGLEDQFVTQALGTLTVPQTGDYTFRLLSDDGSRLTLDGATVVDNDGLHSSEQPKDGAVQLTAGAHALRIDHFDNTVDQVLRLEWRPPGASDFTLVPTSALSTDAGVVRVTSPGRKECESGIDSPGDGLPLTAVHPDLTLSAVRPAGFEPKVSSIDWLPDGRMVVLTWGGTDNAGSEGISAGEVFVLSGVAGATDASRVTVQKVAGGLNQPMGMKVVDGTIYVSEKQRLTRLVDTTGDGVTDDYQTVAEFPFSGNFHEFAFGLLYDAPYFTLNLSVAIDFGGATTDPQPVPNRGTTIRVHEDTGQISYVAGGLRTPHGIGRGPAGGVYVTDNQGAWLPSSTLVRVEQDRFFGHYTNPPGPFDDNPVTPPVLWFPQNEIGNSPSAILPQTTGPWAGQLLIGDVTYGGIQRAFLETVNGAEQGAVFRLTQGLEAGVTRLNQGPDGSIYVGGLGAGGNWGQEGKLDHGLQRLTPNGADTCDFLAMRAVPGGFEFEYTDPVSAETVAGLAERYEVEQWRYERTAEYGGPKIDERDLDVTSATVSADGTKVTVQVDGLLAGHVVHVRSPRPFSCAGGEPLWSTEAWYTLNSLA